MALRDELRAEPRFKTELPAVLEVVRGKAFTLSVRITNLSALGFQFEAEKPLQVGELVRLRVEGYCVFAQVQHCVPVGSFYRIGLERVDPWEGQAAECGKEGAIAIGRPALQHPVGSLRGAALRGLFSDRRLRSREAKPLLGWLGLQRAR